MNPVERALNLGQARDNSPVFGKDTITDTLYNTVESPVWMPHKVDINMGPNPDILQFGFAKVRNDIPGASVDERKDWAPGTSVSAFGDVHVSHVSIEGSDNAA